MSSRLDDPTPVLALVADTSGSMREQGKAMLARNLIAHVRAQGRLGEVVVIQWGSDASVVELATEEDLPPLPVGGRAQARSLLAELDRLTAARAPLRVLLLSDGQLPGVDVAALMTWRQSHPEVQVRALAIGPDASAATLRKLSDEGGVFPAEEVFSVIRTWDLPQGLALPNRISELVGEAAGGRA